MHELRWYLEHFLDYPFYPETVHADRILDALKAWGAQAYAALFSPCDMETWLAGAGAVKIRSDAPHILTWPWEALFNPREGYLARRHGFERMFKSLPDAIPIWALPEDRVNILLVVARPFDEDVRYGSVARPLIDLIRSEKLAVHVDVLRPPTFEQLRMHLQAKRNFYHVLHFDCHGNSSGGEHANGHSPHGAGGYLIFEHKSGGPEDIAARDLGQFAREHSVPLVILNACQSAQLDPNAEDAFASVATALLQGGVRSVIAMAYSLYVGGAQLFLPAFYRELLIRGGVAEAVRAGRLEMLTHQTRAAGEMQDWLVPVLYQQNPLPFSFAQTNPSPFQSRLPVELQDRGGQVFIGRDGSIRELEHALHRPTPAILIRGLAGIGKTTLARAFLHWLDDTGGIDSAQWFDFRDIYSSEYVINQIGEVFCGPDFRISMNKLDLLGDALKGRRILIVWDNFECAASHLKDQDRSELLALLDVLRDKRTKVIVASRTSEEWLGSMRCFDLALRGLVGEDRWAYCEAILRDVGLGIDHSDPDLGVLIEQLAGHPLAMRAVLPKLAATSPTTVLAALRSNLTQVGLDISPEQRQLFAALHFVEQELEEDLRPLLKLIGLHEGYFDADLLEAMAKQVDSGWTREHIDRLSTALYSAGLAQPRVKAVSETHPLLSTYLRSEVVPASDQCQRAFVNVMATLAGKLTPQNTHQPRVPLLLNRANFYVALGLAERLSMDWHFAALTQCLAVCAQDSRDNRESARLFEMLVQHWSARGDLAGEASACHQLGMIAQAEGDAGRARTWYFRSIAIEEQQGNLKGAAITYHQLGRVAEGEQDLDGARHWYIKSLSIFEAGEDSPYLSSTYHQLGSIAESQSNLALARDWYQKSLVVKEKQGDLSGAALTYQQLGSLAEEDRDFGTARAWYRKSLTILRQQGNLQAIAVAYHQLGLIDQQEREFGRARMWYLRAIAIKEKLGDLASAAITYHGMGRIAEEQGDLETASDWYRKSLAISEKEGVSGTAALAYHQLGSVAEEKRDFTSALNWYRKSLLLEEEQGNLQGIAHSYHQLGSVARKQREFATARDWLQKSLAISKEQQDDHASSITSGELGIIAGLEGNAEECGKWMIRSVAGLLKTHDPSAAEANVENLMLFYDRASSVDKQKIEAYWQEADVGPFPRSNR